MIKPNDLRIGNIVEYYINEEGIEWEASKLDWQDIRWASEANENFNKVNRGIPLTEDWLVKLGFVKSEWDNNNSFRKMVGNNDYTIVFYSSCVCEIGDIITKEIKHVHQLQNLIFAITGEELTVHES